VDAAIHIDTATGTITVNREHVRDANITVSGNSVSISDADIDGDERDVRPEGA
jgi:hypothetical protein